MTKTFRVIIEKDAKGYHGYAPALKGCHTWGKTVEDTRKNLQEAIELYVEVLLEDGEPIPADVGVESYATIEIPEIKSSKKLLKARRAASAVQYAKVASFATKTIIGKVAETWFCDPSSAGKSRSLETS